MKKKKEQPTVIQAVDDVLSMLRQKWIDEKNEKEKAQIFKKIDSVLEERFRLMKLRDSGQL